MNPSSLRTCAKCALIPDAGISSTGRSMRAPLRIRVSMSANGSVIMVVRSSPTRLRDAGNQAVARQISKTDAADAELPIDRSGPSADLAAHFDPDPIARPELRIHRIAPMLFERRQLL